MPGNGLNAGISMVRLARVSVSFFVVCAVHTSSASSSISSINNTIYSMVLNVWQIYFWSGNIDQPNWNDDKSLFFEQFQGFANVNATHT